MNIKNDAQHIIDAAIKAALPDNAVKKALEGHKFSDGRLLLIAIGKAVAPAYGTSRLPLDKIAKFI